MPEPCDRVAPAEAQGVGGHVQTSSKPVPQIVRRTTTELGWRHVNGIALVRSLVAVLLVCLGSILLAIGYWWGASLFVVAGLVGALAWSSAIWGPDRRSVAG
jgi:hypothetical protein